VDVDGDVNATGYRLNGVLKEFSQWSNNGSNIQFNTGNVGIGTATPSASLHISGSSSNILLEIDSPATNNILFVSGSGRVGIGTSNPSTTLDISGSARITNGLTVTGSLIINPTGSFVLPLSQSATPQTGSAYWSGSLMFIYNGTRYMSASFF
jgi:hypothetical protein